MNGVAVRVNIHTGKPGWTGILDAMDNGIIDGTHKDFLLVALVPTRADANELMAAIRVTLRWDVWKTADEAWVLPSFIPYRDSPYPDTPPSLRGLRRPVSYVTLPEEAELVDTLDTREAATLLKIALLSY